MVSSLSLASSDAFFGSVEGIAYQGLQFGSKPYSARRRAWRLRYVLWIRQSDFCFPVLSMFGVKGRQVCRALEHAVVPTSFFRPVFVRAVKHAFDNDVQVLAS